MKDMPMYLKSELTGDVYMVGSNDPPSEGTRFCQENNGGFARCAGGSFVVISADEGKAALVETDEEFWRRVDGPGETDVSDETTTIAEDVEEMIATCARLSMAYGEGPGADDEAGRLFSEAEEALGAALRRIEEIEDEEGSEGR
jgi:hypothetical protein